MKIDIVVTWLQHAKALSDCDFNNQRSQIRAASSRRTQPKQARAGQLCHPCFLHSCYPLLHCLLIMCGLPLQAASGFHVLFLFCPTGTSTSGHALYEHDTARPRRLQLHICRPFGSRNTIKHGCWPHRCAKKHSGCEGHMYNSELNSALKSLQWLA